MAHFLIDENLSRLFAVKLRSLQVRAEDVREVGLQGREDGEILAYAIAHRRTLVTADLRFARRAALREGHAGVVLVRFPSSVPYLRVHEEVGSVLHSLAEEPLDGQVVVLQPGRVRMRRRLV